MKYVIDTSSLISLSRNFLFFDADDTLLALFEKKFGNGEIIFIDKVYIECERTAKGLVLEKLYFLKNKKLQFPTVDLLPSKKFFNQLDNQFINSLARKKLSNIQYETLKNGFLESADCKLILFSLKEKDCTIVTEETKESNDGKGFKKIPAICDILGIRVITLPEMLKEFSEEVKIKFH